MKRIFALLLTFGLSAGEILAAGPKPKICFTPAEENAEQLVRGGLRLREGAAACDGRPYNMQTQALWDQIDQRFGPRFKQQTDIRGKAFAREFTNDAENREKMWDGRTVLHFRNYPLSAAYCTEIKNSLQAMLKSGWGAFVKQAQRAKDEVEMDYRPCP